MENCSNLFAEKTRLKEKLAESESMHNFQMSCKEDEIEVLKDALREAVEAVPLSRKQRSFYEL